MIGKTRFNRLVLLLLLPLLAFIASCASRGRLDIDPDLNLEFGNKLAVMQLWEEAIYRWENGLKLSPRDARFHNNLAIAYEQKRDDEKAEYHYKRAAKLDPSNEIIKVNYDSFKGSKALKAEGKSAKRRKQ